MSPPRKDTRTQLLCSIQPWPPNPPFVLLSGHCPLSETGRRSFQEMDQVPFARPVTKASWISSDVMTMAFDIERAIALASSGRPGPVHLRGLPGCSKRNLK